MEKDTDRAGRIQRIRSIDSNYPAPDIRAQYIYAKIRDLKPEPTNWDLACFSVEFIAMLSLMEPAFQEIAKKLSAILYEAHYTHEADLKSCLTTQSSTEPKKKLLSGPLEQLTSMELTDG